MYLLLLRNLLLKKLEVENLMGIKKTHEQLERILASMIRRAKGLELMKIVFIAL